MTDPAQPESRVSRRARDPVGTQVQEPIAWAENVFTLLEQLRGPDHSAVKGLRAYIDTARAHTEYVMTNALAGGAPPASVHEAIQARERERADLLAQLEHLDGLTRFTAGVDTLALREDLGARLADWQGLLERQPTQARQILRKLLHGRLIFETFEGATSRGYIIRGQATYGRLLSGVVSVVPPG